jgi:hypothetical protein
VYGECTLWNLSCIFEQIFRGADSERLFPHSLALGMSRATFRTELLAARRFFSFEK